MSQRETTVTLSRTDIEKWARPLRPKPGARVRLYVLPFAGGGVAAFQAWPAGLGAEVEVCPVRLPGRESRFGEPCMVSMEPLADTVAQVVSHESSRPGALPFAIFGHSLGAVVAYEVTRRLSSAVTRSMRKLIVGGRQAPFQPSRYPAVHHLPDDELVRTMNERYNAIPQAVLDEPELLQLVLPVLRGDMQVIETYRYGEGPKLDVDLVALGGRDDTGVPQSSLDAWGELTTGRFESHMLDGGHFFIQSHGAQVFPLVRRALGLMPA